MSGQKTKSFGQILLKKKNILYALQATYSLRYLWILVRMFICISLKRLWWATLGHDAPLVFFSMILFAISKMNFIIENICSWQLECYLKYSFCLFRVENIVGKGENHHEMLVTGIYPFPTMFLKKYLFLWGVKSHHCVNKGLRHREKTTWNVSQFQPFNLICQF